MTSECHHSCSASPVKVNIKVALNGNQMRFDFTKFMDVINNYILIGINFLYSLI